jgi:hypothetical protein
MTKAEREELVKLVRRREQVAKTAAKTRAAELLADVEEKLAAIYRADDERWQTITRAAEEAVAAADQEIAARCREQGIPVQFRPGLTLSWYRRGENASAERRAELRKVATSRIAALEQRAKEEIERCSVEVQMQIIKHRRGTSSVGIASRMGHRLPAREKSEPRKTTQVLSCPSPSLMLMNFRFQPCVLPHSLSAFLNVLTSSSLLSGTLSSKRVAT